MRWFWRVAIHEKKLWIQIKCQKGQLRYKNGRGIMMSYALPSDWKNGEIYDTGIQIKDIASEACNPWQCGDQPWK
ncbi:unnamed protein product [Citrullus colocynthis]|uniref:Uncharacterized protein n=1 Tax=Citrullus colocynthis TaxID=252529 RepID=A0ABP0Y6E9_9ROSI